MQKCDINKLKNVSETFLKKKKKNEKLSRNLDSVSYDAHIPPKIINKNFEKKYSEYNEANCIVSMPVKKNIQFINQFNFQYSNRGGRHR